MNNLSDAAGTAVTVQTMVYGNAGGASGAGVAFTRNPAMGAREIYFDFQFNAQGEDVVGGRRRLRDNERLQRMLPAVWSRLNEICRELEALFGDVLVGYSAKASFCRSMAIPGPCIPVAC